MGGVKIQVYSFVISALGRGDRSASRPSRSTAGKILSVTN
jgi:hypothetical protein